MSKRNYLGPTVGRPPKAFFKWWHETERMIDRGSKHFWSRPWRRGKEPKAEFMPRFGAALKNPPRRVP